MIRTAEASRIPVFALFKNATGFHSPYLPKTTDPAPEYTTKWRNQRLQELTAVFNELLQNGHNPTPQHFVHLIKASGYLKRLDLVREREAEMKKYKIPHTVETLTELMKVHHYNEKYDTARNYYGQIVEKKFVINTKIQNILISTFIKQNQVVSAAEVLDKSISKGLVDKTSFAPVIYAFAKLNLTGNALEYFEKMKKNNIKPTIQFFNDLFKNLTEKNKKNIQIFIDLIEKEGLAANEETTASLVYFYSKVNDFQRGYDLIKNFDKKNFPKKSYEYLLSALGHAGKYRSIKSILNSLEPQFLEKIDFITPLITCYLVTNDWDKVDKTLQFLPIQGVSDGFVSLLFDYLYNLGKYNQIEDCYDQFNLFGYVPSSLTVCKQVLEATLAAPPTKARCNRAVYLAKKLSEAGKLESSYPSRVSEYAAAIYRENRVLWVEDYVSYASRIRQIQIQDAWIKKEVKLSTVDMILEVVNSGTESIASRSAEIKAKAFPKFDEERKRTVDEIILNEEETDLEEEVKKKISKEQEEVSLFPEIVSDEELDNPETLDTALIDILDDDIDSFVDQTTAEGKELVGEEVYNNLKDFVPLEFIQSWEGREELVDLKNSFQSLAAPDAMPTIPKEITDVLEQLQLEKE